MLAGGNMEKGENFRQGSFNEFHLGNNDCFQFLNKLIVRTWLRLPVQGRNSKNKSQIDNDRGYRRKLTLNNTLKIESFQVKGKSN